MELKNCGELRKTDITTQVVIRGWAQRIRDHGGKKFVDLRDREGITQIVFDPQHTQNFEKAEEFKREYLLEIFGVVRSRIEGTINKKHKTGEVEVLAEKFTILNKCESLPFALDEDTFKIGEELRMEYRYLYLRSKSIQKTLFRRSKANLFFRNFLCEKGFIEVETPILTASSPEGARDFLVPSRKHKQKAFALSQAPQLFKQLLMVGGFEKYFQIAKCFRDEDLRKDRQYEFTQLDMEVAFWSQKELFKFVEEMVKAMLEGVYNTKVEEEFLIFTYNEVMEKYGCDKPDLRITLDPLIDITELSKNCDFAVFSSSAKRGGSVKGLRLSKGQEVMSRKDIDGLIELSQKEFKAPGLAWMKVMEKGLESSIVKFFSEEQQKEIMEKFNAKPQDILFFVSDTTENTNKILDGIRRHLSEKYNHIDRNKHIFCWVIDFPLFSFNEDTQKLEFEHNPFTMPKQECVEYLLSLDKKNISDEKEKLLSLKSDCYDLVYNGFEILSGAQRISNPNLQKKIFELVGLEKEEIEKNFGWFVKAYNYGAPTHRGCAFGLDRIFMILEQKSSIREVIAFPINKHGFDPLTKSPKKIKPEELKEFGMNFVTTNK